MNQHSRSYKVLGIMSGTSLDGIDFCATEFNRSGKNWDFKILATKTIDYDTFWKSRLIEVENSKGEALIQAHFEYGKFLGKKAKLFLNERNLKVNYIASHGHTIFHQIDKGFTFQLGHGAAIAAESGLQTISDFRSLDVAFGGQGAPLVPFGDFELFDEYEGFLNLGGIANISLKKNNRVIAFDISAANMVLNYIYQQANLGDYDKDGAMAKSGSLNKDLFLSLNDLKYYQNNPPKSIGKEWVFENIIPLIAESKLPTEDLLYTFTKHLVFQIHNVVDQFSIRGKVLVTGGGIHNSFILELLNIKSKIFVKPLTEIIDFKEALIFAFLGLNRILRSSNTLSTVTGASKNSIAGSIFLR